MNCQMSTVACQQKSQNISYGVQGRFQHFFISNAYIAAASAHTYIYAFLFIFLTHYHTMTPFDAVKILWL